MSESDDVLVPNHVSDAPLPAWATEEILPPIVILPEQMESIRDRWMRPLVERIAAVEREVGRLESQHLHARRATDTALQERDEALLALADMALECDQLRSERDALLTTRTKLRDRLTALEYKVLSAQDTTALRTIDAYDIPRQRVLRRQHGTQPRRRGWWPFGTRT
jgi:hypothetical protein